MTGPAPLRLRFDAFEIDEGEARLTREGKPIALPPKAFAVLCALARQPGQLVAKDALLDAVWGHRHVSESVLKTVVSELRDALRDDARKPRYIETASRRGYRFIGKDAAPASDSALRTAPSDGAPIVGRAPGLERLRRAWHDALDGHRRIVWVAGEAGIGKTTLIDRFAAEVGAAVFARGQCVDQYGTAEPYLPVLEALGALCRADRTITSLMRSVAPMWLLQLPWLCDEAERTALRRELAGVGHERMLRELGELLERCTERRPLLLITEDLHWSDHATVQLIDHVARRRAPARLMWLASFRLAEVIAADHPLNTLRHELRLHRLCDEIVLDALSERDVADYVGARFPGRDVPEPFVRALHARTDGLPLFVVNVLDDLIGRGSLGKGDSSTLGEASVTSLQVPANLAAVIGRQMARLPPDHRSVLEAASVCGVEFRPATVADALDRDIGSVADACETLARQQQWLGSAQVAPLPDGSLDARHAFRHALYRQVLYQGLGVAARVRLHRAVAASMARARDAGASVTAAELASHYELAHDIVAALRHYAEAAESALRHFAPREALSSCSHALGLIDKVTDRATRCALELTLTAMRGVATAQVLGVSADETKRAFDHARGLLDTMPEHPMRGLVLHALGLVLLTRGEYAETLAHGLRVHALSEIHSDPVLLLGACSVLGQAHTLQGRHEAAREWLERGIATCETLGDEALQAAFVVDPGVTLYASLAIPLLHLGEVDAARARVETALERARRLGQPMAHMVALWFANLFELRVGDVTRVAALTAALAEVVDSSALAQGRATSAWFRGWLLAANGDARAGHALIRAAYDANVRIGMLSGGSEVLGYAAEASVRTGDLAAAQAEVDEALRCAERLGERVYVTQLHLLHARIASAQGDGTRTRAATERALAEARAQRSPWLETLVPSDPDRIPTVS